MLLLTYFDSIQTSDPVDRTVLHDRGLRGQRVGEEAIAGSGDVTGELWHDGNGSKVID